MSVHAGGASFPRPDWVMCGMQNPAGGVRLLASKELTRAELEARLDHLGIMREMPFIDSMVTQRFSLAAEMRTLTIIDAPDYRAAFKSLFEHWSPEPAARAAIGEGQQEIEA